MFPETMKKDFKQLPSQATPMPYAVTSLADLPGSLQQAAVRSVSSTDPLRSICVFPSRTYLKNWYSWEYVSEQALLFTGNGILHIQAPSSTFRDARIVSLRAADLLYTHLSLILMYGRLELVDENLSRGVVEFNAAGFDIIQSGLQHLLATVSGKNAIPTPEAPPAKTILNELESRSFKFKNGLSLYGLLPGERLLGFVFQPGIRGLRWRFFSLKVSETTVMALTDKQLIIIEEQSRSRFPAYGWIFTFYPRKAIEKIGVSSCRQWQELSVVMKVKTGLIDRRILLEQANVLAWQELWLRFGDLRAVT